MPGKVLTPGDMADDDRPFAGFFGKLPATGDFVSRGLPDAFRRHWDGWLTRHIAPLLRTGPELPPGGLRFRLVSGGRVAAGTILPSADSAGRQFPLSLVLIAKGNLPLSGIDAWCDAGLALLTDQIEPDALWQALDGLAAPEPDGPASGPMQLWATGHLPEEAEPMDPLPALGRLLRAGGTRTV
jgi:type VI secretion system protein ImpM